MSAGPSGHFRFDARVPGRWLLAAATAPGYLPFAPEWGQSPIAIVARPGEVMGGVTVALVPAEEYQGRVVDDEGAPVAGAEIAILGGGTGTTALVPAQGRLMSDASGAFRFRAPEDAVLEARHAGYAPARARVNYAVRVSGKVVLTLRRVASTLLTISGTVDDFNGEPAGDALVSARHKETPGSVPALVRTDPNGRFALRDLAAGVWVLTASRSGDASTSVEAAAGATGVVLRLSSGGHVVGCVRDRTSGSPVAVFTVFVHGADARRESVIDSTGCFDVGGLVAGPADVGIVAPGFAPSKERRVVVPESSQSPARANFELSRGGSVVGFVIDRVTREPLAVARVGVEGTEASLGVPVRNETLTDDQGRFRLDGLAEEAVGLFAAAASHHARLVSIPGVSEGESAGPVTIDLAPTAPGEDPKLELVGIGATLEKRGTPLVVTGVIPTGGAAAVGIGPGDEILAIDGSPVAPMTLGDAVRLLRGPDGTTVTVLLIKAGDTSGATLTVVVPRRRLLN